MRWGTPAEQVAREQGADTGRTVLVGVPVDRSRDGTRVRRRYEVRVRSHSSARTIAGVLAAMVVIVTAILARNAWRWLDPCRDAEVRALCEQPTAWFRIPQFTIGAIGLCTGLAVALYLGRFAADGRIWRRSRQVAMTHGFVVLAWLLVWTIGTPVR